MKIDLNNPQQNLFSNVYITGMDNGVKVKTLKWNLPVLAFTKAQENSNSWYAVTYRTDISKRPLDNYYSDGDIEYQLYYIGCEEDIWDTEEYNKGRVQIYIGEQEAYDEMLEDLYPRTQKLYGDFYEGDVFTDNSLYTFLKIHQAYVQEKLPHILF